MLNKSGSQSVVDALVDDFMTSNGELSKDDISIVENYQSVAA